MATATKWRELSEGEKPSRGQEIRIPGDKQPLGVVIKVGPSGVTYRPHGGGALQLISASAEVEVRAAEEDNAAETEKSAATKPKKEAKKEKASADAKAKKTKAAKPKPEQLEIVDEETESGDENQEEAETEETNGEENEESEETDENEEGENEDDEEDTDVAPTPTNKSVSGWMRIEQLVKHSGVKLGRILKARREGAFEGMTRPDPDYDGVGRKPLLYSPAALKVAKSLTSSGGKGGRPPGAKTAKTKAPNTTTATKTRSTETAESTPRSKPKRTEALSQSNLHAAGESLQATINGIDAEIARLNELKEKLEETLSFFTS